MLCVTLQKLELAQHFFNHKKNTNKTNHVSSKSRLFAQTEFKLSPILRECTAIISTLTEIDFFIVGSKHPTVLFTDHKPIVFLLTKKSNPNHRDFDFNLS